MAGYRRDVVLYVTSVCAGIPSACSRTRNRYVMHGQGMRVS